MSPQVRYCCVECNWMPLQNHCIENIVVFQNEDDVNSGSTPAQYVPPEGCIVERQNSTDGECQLTITTRPPQYNFHVSAVDVLCCAKHVEVFTSRNEYLETCKGVMVQEQEDDSKLFLLQHSFENPLAGCIVKLKSLQASERLWFHSIYVTLVPGPLDIANPMAAMMGQKAFDMDKVKSLVGESELSKGAQQLMASLEAQRPQESSSPMSGLGMMMQMFSQMKTAAGPGSNKDQGQSDRGQVQSVRGQGQSDIGQVQSDQNQAKPSEENVNEKDQTQQETQQDHNQESSLADSSVVAENNNVDPMAKLLRSELERMEKRMMLKVEKLIQQSEDRICARMTELLLTKTQGDSLGLD